MSVSDRLAAALNRIATGTSVVRTRTQDVARLEHNGGTTVEQRQRIEAVVSRLERVADDLEKAIA